MFKGFEKLVESLSQAVSVIYRPIHLKIMTKSTIKSLEALGVDVQNANLKIKVDNGNLGVEVYKEVDKIPSNLNFMIGQELKKQENLEAIIEKAILEISQIADEKINDQKVNESWMLHFIDGSKFASEEEVKNLWAKILAGEVSKPGTYSIKTLKILETMDKNDAELFVNVCKASLYTNSEKYYFLPSRKEYYEMFGLKLLDIIKLEEIGLLGYSLDLPHANQKAYILYDDIIFKYHGDQEKSLLIYKFTESANELRKLIDMSRIMISEEQVKTLFNLKKGEKITLHKMISEDSYMTIAFKEISIN